MKKPIFLVISVLLVTLSSYSQSLLPTKNAPEHMCVPLESLADFEEGKSPDFLLTEFLNDGKVHLAPEITISSGESKMNAKSLKINCGSISVWGGSFYLKCLKTVFLNKGEGVGIWLKSNKNVSANFFFKDANGIDFFVPKRLIEENEDWGYSYSLTDSYRKSNNSSQGVNPVINYPCQFIGFSFEVLEENTTIYMDGLVKVRELVSTTPATVNIKPQKLANLYNLGEDVTVNAISGADKIRLILRNYRGEVLEDKTTDKSITRKLPTDIPGYYDLIIISYRNEIKPENLVDSRLFSYGVVDGDVALNDHLGVGTHIERPYYSANSVDLMSLIGARYMRFGLALESIRENDGSFALTDKTKEILDKAKNRGLKFLCIFHDKTPPLTKELEEQFVEYSKFLLDSYRGVLDKVEIWNEWSNGTGSYSQYVAQQTAENYKKFISAIYPELKSKYPEVEFIGLGGENPQRFKEHIVDMYEAGSGEFMDAMSLHPYRQPRSPDGRQLQVHEINMSEQVQEIIEIAKMHQAKEKVYITEIGYPTNLLNIGITDKVLSEYVVKTLGLLCSTKGVEQVDWYNLYNEDEMGTRGGYNKSNEYTQLHFGLFNGSEYNFAVKPSAMAFRTFSQIMNGLIGVDQFDDKNGFYKLTFEDGSTKKVELVWDNNSLKELAIDAEVKMYNLMGNEILNSGSIKLTKEPIYLVTTNYTFEGSIKKKVR